MHIPNLALFCYKRPMLKSEFRYAQFYGHGYERVLPDSRRVFVYTVVSAIDVKCFFSLSSFKFSTPYLEYRKSTKKIFGDAHLVSPPVRSTVFASQKRSFI